MEQKAAGNSKQAIPIFALTNLVAI